MEVVEGAEGEGAVEKGLGVEVAELRLRLRLGKLRSVEDMRGFNVKEHNPSVHTRACFAFFVNSVW